MLEDCRRQELGKFLQQLMRIVSKWSMSSQTVENATRMMVVTKKSKTPLLPKGLMSYQLLKILSQVENLHKHSFKMLQKLV